MRINWEAIDIDILSLVAGIPALVIAMVCHEYAHARVAVALGDFTPRLMGRLTLNPMAHIDPIGLLMMFLVHFGWAKPVSINPNNFKNPRRDDMLVSFAGPAANFIIAFLGMFVLMLLISLGIELTEGTRLVLWLIVLYNINFGIFNLIPLPPLDGSRILAQLMPWEMQQRYMEFSRYSFIIFLIIIMTPIVGWILIPIQRLILGLYTAILSIIF